MPVADYFLVSGFAMKTESPNMIKVCGHGSLFTIDLKKKKFIGTSCV